MAEPLPALILVRLEPEEKLYTIQEELVDTDLLRRVTGDDVPTGTAIADLFRILAVPDAPAVFPRAPVAGDRLWVSLQYWYPLMHMLRYSLGWARIDRGLWWWPPLLFR